MWLGTFETDLLLPWLKVHCLWQATQVSLYQVFSTSGRDGQSRILAIRVKVIKRVDAIIEDRSQLNWVCLSINTYWEKEIAEAIMTDNPSAYAARKVHCLAKSGWDYYQIRRQVDQSQRRNPNFSTIKFDPRLSKVHGTRCSETWRLSNSARHVLWSNQTDLSI